MSSQGAVQEAIQEEIYFARAITAVILAVRLDFAEETTKAAYDQVLSVSHIGTPPE